MFFLLNQATNKPLIVQFRFFLFGLVGLEWNKALACAVRTASKTRTSFEKEYLQSPQPFKSESMTPLFWVMTHF